MTVSSRRILLITPFAPCADGRHGGARVVHGIVSALSHTHELIVLHPDAGVSSDPVVASRCLAVEAYAPRRLRGWRRRVSGLRALASGISLWADELDPASLGRETSHLIGRYRPDVVQVEYGVMSRALAATSGEQMKVVTIYDPARSQRDHVAVNERGPRLLHRVDAWAAERQQRDALDRADGVVVFSEIDRAQLTEQRSSHAEITTIPLGWDVPAHPLDPLGSWPPIVLFVGNFMHPPNIDAALRLGRQIFPAVRAAHQDATLELVGPSPPADVRALAGQGVVVTGEVDSVIPHLERAAVVVAPVRVGGGSRVKVVEALAFGKAVVGTTLAAAGLDAPASDAMVVADDDAGIAASIVALLESETDRVDLGRRAHEWAKRELSWTATADRYSHLYDRLDARRRLRSDR